MTYLINLFLVPIYYLFIKEIIKNRHKANAYFAIIVGIHAVLFRALANPFNYTDTEGYSIAYQSLAYMSWDELLLSSTEWGVGYVFLNWILGHISTDPQLLFATLSIISIVPVVWFYYKTSENLFLSMMIYLTHPMMYYMSFGVVRQYAAIAFALLSLLYINRYRTSVPLALLSCSFHTSAILFIPFFIWRRFSIKKMGIFKYGILLVIGVICASIVGSLFINYLGSSKYENVLTESENNNNIAPVVLIGSLLIMTTYSRLKYKITDIRKLDILSFLMYGLIIAVFSVGMISLGRATLYFIYVIPVVVTWLSTYTPNNRILQNLYIFMIFLIIAMQLYLGYEPTKYGYSFFWERAIY